MTGSTKTTTRRHTRRAPSRRAEILARAAELMTTRGFAGMSARELAAELEISKANFFYHLKNKEELLYEIIVETLEYCLREVERVTTSTAPAPERLRAVIQVYVDFMIDRTAVMLVWFKERGHLTAERATRVAAMERRIFDVLDAFYRGGMEAGAFRTMDPAIARMSIFGMCFIVATRYTTVRNRMSRQQVCEQLQEFACRALLSKHGEDA